MPCPEVDNLLFCMEFRARAEECPVLSRMLRHIEASAKRLFKKRLEIEGYEQLSAGHKAKSAAPPRETEATVVDFMKIEEEEQQNSELKTNIDNARRVMQKRREEEEARMKEAIRRYSAEHGKLEAPRTLRKLSNSKSSTQDQSQTSDLDLLRPSGGFLIRTLETAKRELPRRIAEEIQARLREAVAQRDSYVEEEGFVPESQPEAEREKDEEVHFLVQRIFHAETQEEKKAPSSSALKADTGTETDPPQSPIIPSAVLSAPHSMQLGFAQCHPIHADRELQRADAQGVAQLSSLLCAGDSPSAHNRVLPAHGADARAAHVSALFRAGESAASAAVRAGAYSREHQHL